MSHTDSRLLLKEITLVTSDDQRFPLGGLPYEAASTASEDMPTRSKATKSSPTLETEAMRWTYVLRSRERWMGDPQAVEQQRRIAAQTLFSFGLTDEMLRKIAAAGSVMVQMPFERESQAWAARIFPWEFILAAATRRFRGRDDALTVMRHLRVPGKKIHVPRPEGKLLIVRCLPGALQGYYDVSQESEMVRRLLAPGKASTDVVLDIATPTLQALSEVVAQHRPDVVHFCGCDNHQGLRLLRDLAGPKAPVARAGNDPTDTVHSVAELLDDPSSSFDGVMLSDLHGRPRITSPEELGRALSGGVGHEALLVCLNMWNSAARIAPLLLPHGPLASIGFQDVFDDSLAEYFYETFYRNYRPNWDLPFAFREAWGAIRKQTDLGQGTGIALWGRAPLIGTIAEDVVPLDQTPATPPPTPAPRAGTGTLTFTGKVSTVIVQSPPSTSQVEVSPSVTCHLVPEKELNYSLLHNGGALFKEFELRNGLHPNPARVDVLVELHVGSEQARYAAEFEVAEERFPLRDRVQVPLTASLMRSVSEAMLSTLFVQVRHGSKTLKKETLPLRLLPVDQWLDNNKSGHWLPSFVLPRDPAVESAIAAAQKYVRVIRDDPTAGFEGYQNTKSADPETLEQVDLQVEAIWAALLHEWQLGYVNPPPTYAAVGDDPWYTDSQRLRTPSATRRTAMGTCIDLALLFAACLELVDVYPVIFLLNGHALPGYWRHSDFQAEWRRMADPMADEPAPVGDAMRNAAPGAQRLPWKVGGRVAFREMRRLVRSGRLVPLETVRLTEHSSFREAMQAGLEALSEESDFDSIVDVLTARRYNVTPLPIMVGERA